MRMYLTLGLMAAVVVIMARSACAVTPTKPEIDQMHRWAQEAFRPVRHAPTSATLWPPFSFTYDGKSVGDVLVSCKFDETTKKLDPNRTQMVQTYKHEATGLEVRCVIVRYSDYPAVEWTLYFRNSGEKDTPIIENVKSLDTRIERADLSPGPSPEERGGHGDYVLHGNRGDVNAPASFQPFQKTLAPGTVEKFAPNEGKATSGAWPYFNLQTPRGGRVIVIGWPGQWSSEFTRDDTTGLHVTAGQQNTRFKLKPGEEIRSPLTVMLFWQGDSVDRGRNLWRRFYVAHNMPRTAGGKLPPTQLCGNNQQQIGFMAITEENQKEFLKLYLEKGLDVDYWWIDTGWFECGGDWWQTGTWEVDKTKFPNGLKAVSDYAHSRGKRFIAWFEPERVGWRESWLAKNHPDWLIPGIWGSFLLNLAEPAAAQWLTEHIDKMITEQGIDIYRQDFNIPPIDCWKSKDTPDRQGITENLHNQAYLKFWDTLLQRHPDLRIDACASGGRRNDLETMRRAVPLHRTDCNFDPIAQQCAHYGLASWLPYSGTGCMVGQSVIPPPDCPRVPQPNDWDAYFFRSAMSGSTTVGVDARRTDLNYDFAKRLFAQFRQVTPFYFYDFYPLTDYSLADNVWIAWQYDRPETGEGVVQAFRRDKSDEAAGTFKLSGLDPEARYRLSDLDTDAVTETLGKDLMEKGLAVGIATKPGSAILTYKRLN